jgi:hypothetical protein
MLCWVFLSKNAMPRRTFFSYQLGCNYGTKYSKMMLLDILPNINSCIFFHKGTHLKWFLYHNVNMRTSRFAQHKNSSNSTLTEYLYWLDHICEGSFTLPIAPVPVNHIWANDNYMYFKYFQPLASFVKYFCVEPKGSFGSCSIHESDIYLTVIKSLKMCLNVIDNTL